MVFELGKYYKHESGKMMHVLVEANTTVYGDNTLIAEDDFGNLIPVGRSEYHCKNYTEVQQDEWDRHFVAMNG